MAPTTPVPAWPELRVADWQDTRDTLHLDTQVIGKVRLANEPLNNWWNSTLSVTARGPTTSLMPHSTGPAFQVDFDLLDHRLELAFDLDVERIVADRKRMATVAGIYHIERHRRSPHTVARQFAPVRLVPSAPQAPPKPVGKKLWASLQKSMKTVIATTFAEGLRRDPE